MKRFLHIALLSLVLSSCCSETIHVVKTYKDGTADSTCVKIYKQADHYTFTMTKEQCADLSKVELIPSFARAKEGDRGFFLTPDGMYCKFKGHKDGAYVSDRMQLAMWGSQTPEGTWLAISRGMRLETAVIDSLYAGIYSLITRIDMEHCGPYEDIIIDYYPLTGEDATYSGMGRRYRKYQLDRGEVTPLKERVKDNPYLAYAAEAPEIRIRHGWKPAPPQIDEQTLENEPPMRVAVTFDRVKDIIDSLKARGVDKAELCLVGWNIRGHDGRWPTAFPVEPALGGEEKLKELVKYGQENGFQMVCHTNSGDCYTVSPDLDPEDIARTPDQQWQKNAKWSGGQMYNLCYKAAWEHYVPQTHDKVLELGFKGIHYIDVLSVVRPTECYHPAHKVSRAEATEYAKMHLEDAAAKFGGVASEGGYDHVISCLDYILYSTFLLDKESWPELSDGYVPVWNVVYNGIILNNCSTSTVNYPVKTPAMALKAVELASRPLFYFYSSFKDDGDHWMGAQDIRCGTEEELSVGVQAIQQAYETHKKLSWLQYEFLEDHCEIAPGIMCSIFSDGTIILCNYTDAAFDYEGTPVPPMDYAII